MRTVLSVVLSAAWLYSAKAQDAGAVAFAQFAEQQIDSFILRRGIQEKVYLHVDRPHYTAGDTIWLKAYLVNAATHTPSRISKILYVELIDKRDTVIHRIKLMPSDGKFFGYVPLPDTLAGNCRIRAYTNLMRNVGDPFFFYRTLYISHPASGQFDARQADINAKQEDTDFDVRFFPEGGCLITGMENQVAFKAIGTNGLSVNVSGKIFDQAGELVSFESVHAGMGKFSFTPQAGKQYFALVRKGVTERRFELPPSSSDAVYLNVIQDNHNILVRLRAGGSLPGRPAILMGHTRGIVYYNAVVNIRDSLLVRVPQTLFPSGIVHFTVFTPDTVPLSERLVFVVNNKDMPEVKLTPDKSGYGRRSKVKLNLAIPGISEADLSVSVTGHSRVACTGLEQNILSSLLLTSDISGYVESPGYYFNDTVADRRRALDLMMMTQGWSRFDLTEAIRGRIPEPAYHPEKKSMISGTVVSEHNRPLRKSKVNLFVRDTINGNTLLDVIPDQRGRFVVEGVEHPEGAIFMVREENAGARILMDAPDFPAVATPLIHPGNDVSQPGVQQQTWQDTDTAGDRSIRIREVEITASRRNTVKDRFGMAYDVQSARVMGPSEARQNENKSALSVLSIMPGVKIERSRRGMVVIKSLRYGAGFSVYIDGFHDQGYSRVQHMEMQEVEQIIIKDQPGDMAMYGFTGAGGVIEIKTRRGSDSLPGERPTVFVPLGYQQKRQFYIPEYEVGEQALARWYARPTIYWNPVTPFIDGKSESLEFTTGDDGGGYTVSIEGMAESGALIYQHIEIR
ncbi:MAG: hypothetical protein LBL04_03565 [Bacteroidales bacterium]|jgi:hypothetical protein|nr:hypothetical protein [Bacteroidales bacterium]